MEILYSPLSGPVAPLQNVPDPVFAQGMAGDGLAIDPIDSRVLSPCSAKVKQVHRKRHAVTLVTDQGAELLIHVGIETVNLGGEGFEVRVSDGQRVQRGDVLLEFDPDLIVRKAKSLVTVILVANSDRFRPTNLFRGDALAGKTPLFIVGTEERSQSSGSSTGDGTLPYAESAPIVVEAEHGIHARPAATLADTARRFKSTITISGASGRSADAKSVVALLGLEIERGDAIRITARGLDANEAKEALESAGKAFGLAENQATTRTAVAPRPILPAQPWQEEAGIFRGVSASPGLAVGRVAKLVQPVVKVKEHGADATVERNKLHEAVAVTRGELDAEAAAAGNGQSEILLAHRILLEDPQLLAEAENWIGQGKSAGWAWQTAAHGCAERIKSLRSGVLARAGGGHSGCVFATALPPRRHKTGTA